MTRQEGKVCLSLLNTWQGEKTEVSMCGQRHLSLSVLTWLACRVGTRPGHPSFKSLYPSKASFWFASREFIQLGMLQPFIA